MSFSIVDDEYPVEPPSNKPLWSENYVLTFFDPESGVGSLLSMGGWVIQPKIWRSMSYLSLPNDRVLVSKNFGKSSDPKIPDSGVFQMEILQPGHQLRYIYDGPIDERTMTDLNTSGYRIGKNDLMQFDLKFESDAPIWDMHAGLPDNSNTEQANANFNSPEGHIEQHGTISGVVRYGTGETFAIKNAPATRDHSRGVRNFTNYKGHIWTNGIFPSGRGFHVFTMKTHGFESIAAGRAGVIVDGKLHDADLSPDTAGWLDEPGQLFQPFTLSIKTRDIGELRVRAVRIQDSVPMALTIPADIFWSVPTQSRLTNVPWVNEQKVTWNWDGEIGYGHLERGNSKMASTDLAWLEVFRQPSLYL